jgi:hypothetical protein
VRRVCIVAWAPLIIPLQILNFYEMLMLTLWTNKRTRHKKKATLLFYLLVFKFT